MIGSPTRRFSALLVAALATMSLVLPAGAAAADASGPGLVSAYPFVVPAKYSGASADTAAASCWEIKQLFPASTSGIYWLLTPTMTAPAQFWCDQETDGGGWVKVGAGREGWETLAVGRGTASTLLQPTPAPNTATTQLSAEVINGLLDGAPVTALTDGVRVRRAANTTGTSWQEVRFKTTKPVGWFWSFGAPWPVNSWTIATSTGTSGSTANFGTGTSTTVVDTRLGGATQKYTWGFSYGSGVTGTNSGTSYLWSYTNNLGGARPWAEVYVRPKLINPEVSFTPIPDSGTSTIEEEVVPDSRVLTNSWGVTGIAGPVDEEGDVEVQAMTRIGNTMYVGGNFATVQQDAAGTGQVAQPFLAAFDASTGAFLTSFRPTLNQQVQALTALPDGRLAVGGKFTSVNGTPVTGLVVLDPTTGAVTPGWNVSLTNNVSPGLVRILVLTADSNYLYVGGTFTHTTGPNGHASYARNAMRLSLSTFNPDSAWQPVFNGSVQDMELSEDGTKAYMAGFFDTYGGTTTAKSAAAVLTSTPAQLDPVTWTPVWSSSNDYQQGIEQVGNRVYVGGSEHSLFSFDTSTYARLTTQINDPKGDNQVVVADEAKTFLWAGSHSNNYTYQGATNWPSIGTAWKRADTISWIGVWRLSDVSPVSTFTPVLDSRRGSGAWAVAEAPNGNVWVGGDFIQGRGAANKTLWTGGFARFALSDGTAPNVPTNLRVTAQTATTVTLAWNVPTGGVGSGGTYQVLRDDRTIVSSTKNTVTVPLGGANRFFVRAVDATGNASASTAVLVVPGGNPAPVSAFTYGATGMDVTFTSTATDNGAITGYYWTFGDGSTSTLANPTHHYARGGTYQVGLVVVDDQGSWTRGTQAVDLTQPAPADAYGAAVYQDAPLLYWRLGEGSGTTAADSTAAGAAPGSVQNGVTLGAAGALAGVANSAGQFDGSNDQVVSTQYEAGRAVYSTEAWFKTTTTRGGMIIGFGNGATGSSGSYDRRVFMLNTGQLAFGVYPGVDTRATTTNAYNDGLWHHVVATQSADGMKVYVDGILSATNPQTAAEQFSGYWRIGGDPTWSGETSGWFAGTIDEAAVYDYALDATQVTAHYALGMGQAYPETVPTDSYAQTVLADNPDTYWRLGSVANGVAGDDSPGYQLGQAFGTVTTSAAAPPVTSGPGSAVLVGNGWITDRNLRPAPSTYATELWFKTTSTTGGKLIGFGSSATGLSSSNDRHVFMLNSGQLVFGAYPGTEVRLTTSAAYNNGQWHHVVAQQGPSGMALYVDGVLVASNGTTTAQSYSGYWKVGGDTVWSGSTSRYFTGQIGEVAIYSAPLSADRIAAHYAEGIAPVNQVPTAAFTSSTSGLTASLDGSGSVDPDGSIAAYTWNLGDGTTATGATVEHTYDTAGEYTVVLTVTDSRGAIATVQHHVTVEASNVPPTAAFTSTVSDLRVDVDGATSTDPDGVISSYAWAFGDGATGTGATASHTYPATGTYTVTLTVTDNRGATATTTADVSVLAANQLPTAAVTALVEDLKVDVDASASTDPDGALVSYAWAFGDGATATGVTASHSYAAAGTYTIALTVTDNRGGTATATKAVTVTAPVGVPVTTTPIAMDATWSWWYQTAAPAAAWKTTAFDASAWPTGGARLGFGTASIVTNIDTFATTSARPITAYFRKTFAVSDTSRVVSLTLNAVGDDGVVVYVNGTEVGRQNMPSGTITHTTFASSARRTTVADGGLLTITVPTSLLVNGTNVISAETHLNYRGTPDASFRLEATQVTLVGSANQSPTAEFSTSASGLVANVDGSASADPDGTIASYAWTFGDGATATGVTASHTYAAAGTYTVTLTVTDNRGGTASVSHQVTAVQAVDSTPVAMDATWSWWYQTAAPAAGWKTVGFDASAWPTGGARLGFGSTSVVTNIDTFATTSARPVTAYFRKTFTVTDASKVVSLTLNTVGDDGVVVYVNGTEVGRQNMPSGTITHTTFASAARRTTVADASPLVITVPVNLLVSGTNVITAETHLNYRGTPDVSFRLQASMSAMP